MEDIIGNTRFGANLALRVRRQGLHNLPSTFYEHTLTGDYLKFSSDFGVQVIDAVQEFIDNQCEGHTYLRWIDDQRNGGLGTFRLSFANRDDRTLFQVAFPAK